MGLLLKRREEGLYSVSHVDMKVWLVWRNFCLSTNCTAQVLVEGAPTYHCPCSYPLVETNTLCSRPLESFRPLG